MNGKAEVINRLLVDLFNNIQLIEEKLLNHDEISEIGRASCRERV